MNRLPTLDQINPWGTPQHCCRCQVGWHAMRPDRCWSCGGPAAPGDVRYGHLWGRG